MGGGGVTSSFLPGPKRKEGAESEVSDYYLICAISQVGRRLRVRRTSKQALRAVFSLREQGRDEKKIKTKDSSGWTGLR